MKSKIKIMLFVLAFLTAGINNSIGQVVTLVDPNGDGGFENGSTFAANGWTVAAGVANNQWFVGNAATPFAGSNCAYISQTGNGSSYTYNGTSTSTVYFYKDIAFPAGKSRIVLKLNWFVNGEPFFDRGFVGYTDPANTPVVNDYLSSTFPPYLTAVTSNANSWSATSPLWSANTTYILPASFAGTTKRIVFGWQNNNTGTFDPPIAFDNISLTAEPPITCTPTVNGGLWSDPASWTGGNYPGAADDVLIPDGTSITVDVSQTCRNITVGQGTSGILNFTTSFNALTVTNNITVNNGGQFNGFIQSATPTSGGVNVAVAGNINLNAGGTMTMGHSGAVLTMNGTSAQSINGPGVFLEGLVRTLKIANPTSVTLNTPINVTEQFGHYAGTLNTNGNLTLDCNKQSYGNAYNQQVYTVVVNNMGTGYTSQPSVTIAPPTGAGTQATAIANWDAATLKVRSITITNPGSGYRANAAVTITGGGGSGAAATAVVLQSLPGNAAGVTTFKNGGTTINGGLTINNSQGVSGISITNTTTNNIGYASAPTVGFGLPVRTFLCPTQGSGYTTATVSFTYPSGTAVTPATATALVVNGKVTSISITGGGIYVGGNGTVNVVITGTNTTPASGPTLNIPVATAIVTNGMVSDFNITNAGSDYIAAPTITLAGGTPSAAAAAPICRIGLYNVNYSTTNAPTGVAAPVGYTIITTATLEGPEIPANRKLNTLTINNPKHLSLNDNLELTAASSAIGVSNGIINFSGANKTITCSNPAYAGVSSATSATLPSFVNGIVTLNSPGGTSTRTFPVGRGIAIVAGTGSGAFGPSGGSDITTMTAQTDIAPTGSFTAGTFAFTGIRTYNVVKNGTQFGTAPTATLFWGVEDNLASDNATIHVAQATATSGSWTVKSIAGAAGLLSQSGSKATATTTPGPISYNANDYFTFATTFTPPPGLNYVITRTTGNPYNSIAATGSSIPSWQGSISTETQISNAVSLAGTTFQYQGTAVTGFRLGIDGYFTFNTAFGSNISTVQLGPSSSPITSALAAFWGNLGCNPNDFTAASRDASIKYKIDGSLGSGSAVITIEWIHMTGSQNPVQNTGSDLNFQIKLFESDNHIEFNYGLMQGFDGSSQTSWSYACGMNGSFMQPFTAPGQILALQEHDENTTNFSYEKAQVANAGANILHTLPECYSSYIFTPGTQVPYVPGSIIPVNDEPAGAVVLTELASPPTDYCGAKYTSYGATATLTPVACTGVADDDVWFKFTATDPSTAVKVVSSAGYDAAIEVYDASLNPLAPVVCKDTANDGRVEIAKISGLTISNQYYVRVYHKLGGTQATAVATVSNGNISNVTITNPGSGYAIPSAGSNGTPRVRVSGGGGNNGVLLAQTLGTNAAPGGITGITVSSIGSGYTSAPTITIDPPSAGLTGDFAIVVYANSPPPSNDLICGAIPLTVNTGTCNPTAGTTFGATASGGVPSCTGTPDDDVFYSFVATSLTTAVKIFSSAGFNGVVQVLSSSDNTCNGILTTLACIDNNLTGGNETATLTAGQLIQGNTYFVRVFHSGSGAGSGDFSICIFESGPPCPAIVSPLGTLASTTGTNLVWNAVAGATGYDVYLSTVQNDVITGAPAALVSSNLGITNYATGPLVNGTTYYWRVDSRNAIGASDGCNVKYFVGTNDIIIGSNASGICSGNIYDSGGLSAGYQVGENAVSTICPSAGASTKITFSSFNTNFLLGGEDVLYIYNGPSTSSPLFPGGTANATVSGFPAGGFFGFNGILPNTSFTSTDASGCITLQFKSDPSNTVDAGWAATVSCEYLCTALPTYPANNGPKCFGSTAPLSWPVNPVATGYDVYFGTTNTPSLVSSNQPGATYNPGPLAVGTYYWKVVSIFPGNVPCPNPILWSFDVVDLPITSVSSNSPICSGLSLLLNGDNLASGQTTGNSWLWTGPNGFNDIFQNPVVPNATITNSGNYILTVTNQYGCTATDSTHVDVVPLPILSITNQVNVSCNGGSDGSYNVVVTNDNLGGYLYNDSYSSPNSDGIFTGIPAGSYTVEVTDANSCAATIPVTITEPDPTTLPDAGPNQTVCFGSTVTLAANTAQVGTGTWTVVTGSGTFANANNPATTVTGLSAGLNAFSWTIDNAICSITNFDNVDITTNPLPTAVLSGTQEICNSSSANLTINFTGTGPWTYAINGGTPVSTSSNPETVSVTPSVTTTYTITSLSDANCSATGTGSAVVTVTNAPPPGSCTLTAATMPTTAYACVGQTYVVSTNVVTGATRYTWSVPAGTLINGQAGPLTTTTNTVTLTLGAVPANSSGWEICAFAGNACGNTNTNCKYIRGSLSMPSPIVGSNVACASSTGLYSTTAVSGALGYAWTGTSGITFTGSGLSVTANFPSGFTSGTICVAATFPCGYSGPTRCITVTNGVPLLGAMSGSFSVCPGTNGVAYSVPAANGVQTYNWTVPTGITIASGTGTNAITVNVGAGFTNGNICVIATTACGVNSAPRCKTVASNKPATPGNITGPLSGVCGQTITYSIATVSGATSYTWTAPSGASLSSPNGLNTVDVTYTNGFTTGQLCVTANNACGASASRCVNAKGTPSNPGAITGPATVCSFDAGIAYSITPVFGATGYIWTVPAGATIVNGQNSPSILVDWGATGGTIGVTAVGSCGNSGTTTKAVSVTTCARTTVDALPGTTVNAYPNPVSTLLNIDLNTVASGSYSVEMMDVSGRIVKSIQVNAIKGMNTNTIDVSDLSKGVYMLSVRNADGFTEQLRIAVQ